MELDFSKKKPIKCKHCGKEKGKHKGYTLNCPRGPKTRIGYLDFDPVKVYEPKEQK